MTSKDAGFKQIDNEILPSVINCLRDGLLVVLIGVSGTGKTVLAKKALPVGMIADELYGKEVTDEFIRNRDQALATGRGVIFTGQLWVEVAPHLVGLMESQYKVFDFNLFWEKYGRTYHMPNSIPSEVLVN